MDPYFGPSDDQERLGGFSNWWLSTSFTRAGQILSPHTGVETPEAAVTFVQAWYVLQLCLEIRKKQTKVSKVLRKRGLEKGEETKGSKAVTSPTF